MVSAFGPRLCCSPGWIVLREIPLYSPTELASLALLYKALPSALLSLSAVLLGLATPASLEGGEGAEGRETP